MGSWTRVEKVKVLGVVDQINSPSDMMRICRMGVLAVAFSRMSTVDSERMAVHASAFVAFGNIGQPVCRFEVELLVDLHDADRRV